MIATIWDALVGTMRGLGFDLDATEADSLVDRKYTVRLPSVQRGEPYSTMAKARVVRDIRVRIQFKERRDAAFHRAVAEEVERVVVGLRGASLLFESSALEERPGGVIAEVQFSAVDSMN